MAGMSRGSSCLAAAIALGLDSPLGMISPCCGGLDELTFSTDERTARCGLCGAGFDAATLKETAEGRKLPSVRETGKRKRKSGKNGAGER